MKNCIDIKDDWVVRTYNIPDVIDLGFINSYCYGNYPNAVFENHGLFAVVVRVPEWVDDVSKETFDLYFIDVDAVVYSKYGLKNNSLQEIQNQIEFVFNLDELEQQYFDECGCCPLNECVCDGGSCE